ncbi:unnamed protein product [Lepeophtheirus salmonis]|uniref:(salmon louse) hypothetical protein n=1 Tax=Lepeophtheirus salmonis TaxID=72036 RepID=A0A7R8CGE9_LEPSM|nr:unnamed protein product [Lepeophtheirus salmonis]CAF2815749.1 unnamed protein product [Lepeophtheirus salmonis]
MIWCEYNKIRLNNFITYGFLFFCGLFSYGAAIQCWECNSKTDPGCSDPFKGYSLGSVNCSQINDKLIIYKMKVRYILKLQYAEKKTVQTVEEEVRIIRGCGWVQNDEKLKSRDCFSRVGTMGVSVYHCTCNTDGCNGLQK